MDQQETGDFFEDEFLNKNNTSSDNTDNPGLQEEEPDTRILNFIGALQPAPMNEKDKLQLRNRLERSLPGKNRKMHWSRWAAAAVLLIGILTTIWVAKEKADSEMMAYVNSLEISEGENNTLLILGDKKKISIAEENSNIDCQPDERNIRINQNREVEAVSDSLKPVFNTIVVPYGKRSQIVLSDGTKVWLNSGTKFVFPASFKTAKREVFLQGEAVFDVTHLEKSSFYVKTNDFSIRVLGTVFNVTAYADDDRSSAVLERGHIEIVEEKALLSGKTLDMSPGTLAVYNPEKGTFTSTQVNPEDYLSWRNGFLSLHSEKMIDILRKLSRYYNIDIKLADKTLELETFTGNLDLKGSPEEVLAVISRMVPLSVQQESGKIIVDSK